MSEYTSFHETSIRDADAASIINNYKRIRKKTYNPPKKKVNRAPPHRLPALDLVPDMERYEQWNKMLRKMNSDFFNHGYKSLKAIILETAYKYNVTPMGLMGPSRLQIYSQPRFELYYRAHAQYGHPFTYIGRYFDRDHSTIIYGVRKYQAMLDGKLEARDPELLEHFPQHQKGEKACGIFTSQYKGKMTGSSSSGTSGWEAHDTLQMNNVGYIWPCSLSSTNTVDGTRKTSKKLPHALPTQPSDIAGSETN